MKRTAKTSRNEEKSIGITWLITKSCVFSEYGIDQEKDDKEQIQQVQTFPHNN